MPAATTNSTTPARWRVLILPGGTEIGLELRQSLVWCKEVELFSAGAEVSNHAPYVFRRHFIVPSVSSPGWIESLNSLIAAEGITHIFPAHDDVIVALAEAAPQLKARVVSSPATTCHLTRSKRQTLQLLAGTVPVPRLFESAAAVDEFPVFVKPDRGQGSMNAARADTREQLRTLLSEDPSRIILEHLPGPEFTVDCFSDRDRGLLYASGRQRRRIRSGIAMDSVPVADPRFGEYANRIAACMPLHGAWFFQVKTAKDGEPKLLEVAPRVGGTSALSRVRGVNLPLLSLYENERAPVRIDASAFDVEIDRALVNRFKTSLKYSTIYVDFDDTVLVRGKVNPELMKLLFQALNRDVRLVLVTRHAGDLAASLRRCRIEGLFDEVIHLRDRQPKGDFIRERDAILIDDSFAERAAVHAQTGIPVFDPSMVEALLDDRE
jgi:hypothetical protein